MKTLGILIKSTWSLKVNQATPSLSHSPVKAPVPVRTHCTNAWWNRCKTDLNSFSLRKLEETTETSSYHMDENHSAGSEIQRPQYGRRSWPGSEPSTLEIDVYVRRYPFLVVLARNDDEWWWSLKIHVTCWSCSLGYYGTKVGGNSGGSKAEKRAVQPPPYHCTAKREWTLWAILICKLLINKFVYQNNDKLLPPDVIF